MGQSNRRCPEAPVNFCPIAGAKPLSTHERQAHAAHQTFQKTAAAAAAQNDAAPCDAALAKGPSHSLHADSPEVVAQLESLDDAVFDAIQGKPDALPALRWLWPQVKIRLGETLLAESREQYVRYALSVWHKADNPEGDHDPRRAVEALEVLCVLFDEL
jgi:hypothetical protein